MPETTNARRATAADASGATPATSVPCQRGRFSPADIQRAMLAYGVTDRAWLEGRTLADMVQEALAGGATCIQLREKHLSTPEVAAEAAELIPLCQTAGVPFLIDDDVEAARISGADGVHVGQSDTALAEARRILGPDAIIGVSAHTVEEALAAEAGGADYLGVGALFSTVTKTDAEIVTPAQLAEICRAVQIPVTAIGGLNYETVDVLAGTGVDGAAVVSAIFAAENPRQATQELRAKVERVLGGR